MKLIKIVPALLMVLVIFINGLRAQTVDEIVNKYVDAVGGKDKIQQVKTFYSESTTEFNGNEGPTTINLITGVGFKMSTNIDGQSVINAITDKGGWRVNPFEGAATPTAMPDELLKQSKVRLDPFGS